MSRKNKDNTQKNSCHDWSKEIGSMFNAYSGGLHAFHRYNNRQAK